MAEENRHCPNCGQLDMVEKVSTFVKSQTVTGSDTDQTNKAVEHGHWDSVSRTKTRISNLARALTPPSKPLPPTVIWPWCSGLIGLFILIPGGVFSFAAIMLTFNPVRDEELLIMFTLIALTFIIVGVGIIIFSYQGHSKAKMRSWEQANTRWNQLYYCGRDNIIFNPDDGAIMPIAQMVQYLYS